MQVDEGAKRLRWDQEVDVTCVNNIVVVDPASPALSVTAEAAESGGLLHHSAAAALLLAQKQGIPLDSAVNTPSTSTRSNSTASSSAAWKDSRAVSPISSHGEMVDQSAVGEGLDEATTQHCISFKGPQASLSGALMSSSEGEPLQAVGKEGEEELSQPSAVSVISDAGISPRGGGSAAYKLPAVTDTVNETAEATWSLPSSGPTSGYSSPSNKALPLPPATGSSSSSSAARDTLLHGFATHAGVSGSSYMRASLSSGAAMGSQEASSRGYLSAGGTGTGSGGPPSGTPSESLSPDRKISPDDSGRSTPSVVSTSQHSHGNHTVGGGAPTSAGGSGSGGKGTPHVLETKHLQLQTHKPSGRRMINQYIIEDELGRGVHGKVRLAWDTETGERVAVKIVERQSRKRLGAGADWSARMAARAASAHAISAAAASAPTTGKGKERETDDDSPGGGGVDTDSTEPKASASGMRAHFAPSPQRSPGGSVARLGINGSGHPHSSSSRHSSSSKEKEKANKAWLLWTTDKKVKREIAIMKKCAHENVVRLREVIDDPHSKKIFMVLEYMAGGEVQWKDELGRPTMTVEEARRTIRDVVCGLEYLHYQGIIHRDIKPANLLWDEEKRVKISDFGVSHYSYALLVASGGLPSSSSGETRDPSLMDDKELAKTAGSPAFFAPELCLAGDAPLTTNSSNNHRSSTGTSTASPGANSTHSGFPFHPAAGARPPSSRAPRITKAIDVWALGVTLYCLLFGELPFTAASEFALFNVIPHADYELPIYMGADKIRVGPRRARWKGLPEWEDEEADVDQTDPRETLPDVDPRMLDEDARQLRDLLDRLLEKDPEKRIKLEEVKKHPWVTRGIVDPPAWLDATAPEQHPFVEVTHEEVEDALTGFSKIKQRVKRWQSKLFDTFGGRSRSHSQASSSKPSISTPSEKMSVDEHHSIRSAGGKSPRVLWFGKRSYGQSVPATPGGAASASPNTLLHKSAAFGMTPNLGGGYEGHSKAVPHHEVDAILQRIISNQSSKAASVALPTPSAERSSSSERKSIFERRADHSASGASIVPGSRGTSLVRPIPPRSSSDTHARERLSMDKSSIPLTRMMSNASSTRRSVDGNRPISGSAAAQRRASRNRLGELFHFGRSKGGSLSRNASRSKRGALAPRETYQDPHLLQVDALGAVQQVGAVQPSHVPSSAPLLSSPDNAPTRTSMDALGAFPAPAPFRSQPGSPPLLGRDEPEEHDVDLEFDLSDDDLEGGHGGDRHQHILRNDGNGWVSERLSSSTGSRGDSLTPSVEGGYNLFKGEYTGVVQYHHEEGDYEGRIPMSSTTPHDLVAGAHEPAEDGEEGAKGLVQSPSEYTEQSRFADADESSQPSFPASQSQRARLLAKDVHAAVDHPSHRYHHHVWHGGEEEEGQEALHDEEDGYGHEGADCEDDDDEDDGCVSFKAGRSSRSTTISKQMSRVMSRDGTASSLGIPPTTSSNTSTK